MADLTAEQKAIRLACAGANLAGLAACYREEAENYIRRAHDLDPDGEWVVDPAGLRSPTGLPENWTEIGEAELDLGGSNG